MKINGKRLLDRVRVIALFVILLAIAYFIATRVSNQWSEFKTLLANANLWVLFFASVSFWACTIIPVLIWKKFLKSLYGIDVALPMVFCAVVISNAARYIPGKIWFVLLAAYLGERLNLGKAKLITVSIWFQISNLLASFVLGMALFPSQNHITNIATIAILIASIYFLVKPDLISLTISRLTKEKTEFTRKNIGASLYGFTLNTMSWLLYGFSTYLVAKSIFPKLDFQYLPPIIGASSIAYFLGYVALFAPAGLGIREGLLVVMLPDVMSEPTRVIVAVGDRVLFTLAEAVNIVVAFLLIKLVYKLNSTNHNS